MAQCLFPDKNKKPKNKNVSQDLVKKDVMTYRYLRGAQEFGGSQTTIFEPLHK